MHESGPYPMLYGAMVETSVPLSTFWGNVKSPEEKTEGQRRNIQRELDGIVCINGVEWLQLYCRLEWPHEVVSTFLNKKYILGIFMLTAKDLERYVKEYPRG